MVNRRKEPLEVRREVARLATHIDAILKRAESDLSRQDGVRKNLALLVLINVMDFMEEHLVMRMSNTLLINTMGFAREISLGPKKKTKLIDKEQKMQNAVWVLMSERALVREMVEEFLKWRCSLGREGEDPEAVRKSYMWALKQLMDAVPERKQ